MLYRNMSVILLGKHFFQAGWVIFPPWLQVKVIFEFSNVSHLNECPTGHLYVMFAPTGNASFIPESSSFQSVCVWVT